MKAVFAAFWKHEKPSLSGAMPWHVRMLVSLNLLLVQSLNRALIQIIQRCFLALVLRYLFGIAIMRKFPEQLPNAAWRKAI